MIDVDLRMTFFVRSSLLVAGLCSPTVHFLLPIRAESSLGVDGNGDDVSELVAPLPLTNAPLRCFSFFSILTRIPQYSPLKSPTTEKVIYATFDICSVNLIFQNYSKISQAHKTESLQIPTPSGSSEKKEYPTGQLNNYAILSTVLCHYFQFPFNQSPFVEGV